MSRVFLLLAVVVVVLAGGALRAAEPPARPNIVLLLADDLGWADLACYGNTFNETPHLDRLAKEGMRFTQFYAGPVCSPTRANIQSGQNQARFGITQHIPGHRRPFAKLADPVVPRELPLEVVTFAEVLRDAGYATGYFGKWHLGNAGYGPADQGWQTVLETNGNVVPQSVAKSDPPLRAAPFLAGKAIEFLDSHREGPFVMQVSFGAVHIPLSATPALLDKYRAKQPMPGYPSRPEYAGLLEELDTSVGQIVAAIDRLGLAEKTLIVFVSDNGGLETQQDGTEVTSNDPLRGEKGTLYEGGIRVPCIARLPGLIRAGMQSRAVATTTDFFATFLDLVNRPAPEGQPSDGRSLLPLFDVFSDTSRGPVYWHLPHYHHSTPASAIRKGNWKLIEFFEDGSLELYNLRDDLSESHNLAQAQPERTKQMHAALQQWRSEVGARMPVPNPDYDPARATQLGKSQKE